MVIIFQKAMHPVTEVDIANAAFMIHDLRSFGSSPAKSMAGSVVDAAITFRFYNNAACDNAVNISVELFAEKRFGDRHGIFAAIECQWQF